MVSGCTGIIRELRSTSTEVAKISLKVLTSPPVPCIIHTIQIPNKMHFGVRTTPPTDHSLTQFKNKHSFPTERAAMVLSHALLQMGLRYFQFTSLNREVSCQQQTQRQDEICSVDCGPCSSAYMSLPNRSTELFTTSWQRMIEWKWEQLLPVPLHTGYQSYKQGGLWDSSAFCPATEKQAGPLNFMEDLWRKREEAQV